MNKGYPINEIVKATGGKLTAGAGEEVQITYLLLDSRKLQQASETLFFALPGNRQDGHHYIGELFSKGVCNFVVTNSEWIDKYPTANFIVVKDTIAALQKLAGYHRNKFQYPVISITGSGCINC